MHHQKNVSKANDHSINVSIQQQIIAHQYCDCGFP